MFGITTLPVPIQFGQFFIAVISNSMLFLAIENVKIVNPFIVMDSIYDVNINDKTFIRVYVNYGSNSFQMKV